MTQKRQAETTIAKPADEVWARVRDFGRGTLLGDQRAQEDFVELSHGSPRQALDDRGDRRGGGRVGRTGMDAPPRGRTQVAHRDGEGAEGVHRLAEAVERDPGDGDAPAFQAGEGIVGAVALIEGDTCACCDRSSDEMAAFDGAAKKYNAEFLSDFGYHAQIAARADTVKWVQVDLGQRIALAEVVLSPCYDDYNNIGAGFGFPVRFTVEVSDDPEFRQGVQLVWRGHDQTFMMDFPNPGLTPYVAKVDPEELEKMSAFKDFIESLDLDDFDKRKS